MRTKTMLRGAFTVAAPKKRLRAWVGIPVLIGVGIAELPLGSTVKSLALADRPVAAAAVASSVGLAVGAAMCAHPYTRWAGVVVLGWSVLGFATGSYTYGTQTMKDALQNITGAPPVQILGGR